MWRTTFIAITGSLGKTTCKELLAHMLEQHGATYRTIANQNGSVLVALNILRVRPWHRFAVLEVAGAYPGLMQRMAPIVRPDIALVLAMRRTHTLQFTSLVEHAAEKAHLLRAMSRRGIAILYADDEHVAEMAKGTALKVRRFGVSAEVDVRASNVSAQWPDRLSFDAHWQSKNALVQTQLVGEYWLPSALGALATACVAGVPLVSAARAAAEVEPFRGRLQPVRIPSGATFLRDDYNASVDGADASFEVLEQAQAERRILVMSDLSDFGGNRKKRLRYIGARAAQIADLFILVGESGEYGVRRAIEAGLSADKAIAFPELKQAAEFLRSELRSGDLVLLKGRTTDHVGRLYFAQFGSVNCWKGYCGKTMLCEECWELGVSATELERVSG